MLILMTNPKHGSMYVYSEGDAVRHETLGWVRAAPVVPQVEEPKAQEPKAEPVQKRPYVRKVA